ASGEIGLRAGSDGTPALHANGLDLPLAPASLPMAALLLHHGGTPAQWHALLRAQAYRLAWWRSAAQAINWRRFFEIGDLVGVRVERPEVFDAVHALPLALYRAGLIDGLRIDHVDGLAEPGAYCRRLRAELAQAGQA
ncbi:malto-oligosyltrehalose synthase, partial [Bordetella pertussis]